METKAKTTLNVLSKDEQKSVASDIFKMYPKAHKVVVASDGQAFITDEGDSAAKNHAKNNRYKKELELTPFTRDGLEAKTVILAQKKAVEVIAEIEAATTADQISELATGDTRPTVIAAASKKIETLNASK